MRHFAEAQGLPAVAERTGMPGESPYRALSATGNRTIKTLLAVFSAAAMKLTVQHANV